MRGIPRPLANKIRDIKKWANNSSRMGRREGRMCMVGRPAGNKGGNTKQTRQKRTQDALDHSLNVVNRNLHAKDIIQQ